MKSFGSLTGSTIGIVMRECVTRAMTVINTNRHTYEVIAKDGLDGKPGDMKTTADDEAQAIGLNLLKECFPDFGIVAEEDGLRIDCKHPDHDLWIAFDPMDGTRAFNRGQSHGVATQIALICDGKIIGAFIGNPFTGEIFGYRPEGSQVHHLMANGDHRALPATGKPNGLAKNYVLLRDSPDKLTSPLFRDLVRPQAQGGLFQGIEVEGGSIGFAFTRLWKHEIAAFLIAGHKHETPWDSLPVLGPSEQLGYQIYEQIPGENKLRFVQPSPSKKTRDHIPERLVIHGSHCAELRQWVQQYRERR